MELRKGEGIHVFLGRLTAEAAPDSGLERLTIITVNWDVEVHILH